MHGFVLLLHDDFQDWVVSVQSLLEFVRVRTIGIYLRCPEFVVIPPFFLHTLSPPIFFCYKQLIKQWTLAPQLLSSAQYALKM